MAKAGVNDILWIIATIMFVLAGLEGPHFADKEILLTWQEWIAFGSAFFAVGHCV